MHRLTELVLDFVEPLEHSCKAWPRANVVKGLRDAVTLAVAEVVFGPTGAAHAENAVHAFNIAQFWRRLI